MTVRPLDLQSLPRAPSGSPTSAAGFSGMRTRLIGRTADLRTSPFGAGRLTCTELMASRAPDDADLFWALTRPHDEQVAYLLMEGMTALRIVAATLGIPGPRILRPIGSSERGIVTAAVATAARALGSDVSVHLGRRAWHGHGLLRVIITAQFQPFREVLRMDVPRTWLPAGGERPETWLIQAAQEGWEFPFALELARTTLKAGDWARAGLGDVVVFDDQPSWDGMTGRPLFLVCGSFACTVMITPGGQVTMVAEFQSRDRPKHPSTHALAENENGAPMSSTDSPDTDRGMDMDLAVTMLASAPIEVVAEIGRVVMRAEEVTALRPGAVLPLGPLNPTTVSLKVGERTWAEGELVSVNGQLGVRLTAIVPPPRSHGAAGSPNEADTVR